MVTRDFVFCVYFRPQKIIIQNTGLCEPDENKNLQFKPIRFIGLKNSDKTIETSSFCSTINPFELFEPREPFIPLKSLKPFKQFNPFKILNPLSYLNHLGTFLHSSNPLNQCYNLKLFEFSVPV